MSVRVIGWDCSRGWVKGVATINVHILPGVYVECKKDRYHGGVIYLPE